MSARDERDDDDDVINVISGEDEESEEEVASAGLFAEGQQCDVCGAEDGRVGLDPTCRGAYDGSPVLLGYDCLEDGLRGAYDAVDGVAAIVEPFGEYSAHYYYRLDEMSAYQFVREDIEPLSWLMLAVGDDCARCGQQSHVAWLTRKSVDARLPEGKSVFRDLEKDVEHLCTACTATSLAAAYRSLQLPLMTVEVPRSAMGVVMPVAGG